jgi:hypothetical protein
VTVIVIVTCICQIRERSRGETVSRFLRETVLFLASVHAGFTANAKIDVVEKSFHHTAP